MGGVYAATVIKQLRDNLNGLPHAEACVEYILNYSVVLSQVSQA